VEILERHLVDRGRLRVWIEVTGGVDVRSRMIAQRERHRLRCEPRLARRLDFIVAIPDGHDDRGMGRGSRGSVIECAAQVEDWLGVTPPGFETFLDCKRGRSSQVKLT